MDQKTLRERRRRKKRQMMIRRYTKLGICAAGVVLVLVFLIRGIILPLIGGEDGGYAQAETSGVVGTITDDAVLEGEIVTDGALAEAQTDTDISSSEETAGEDGSASDSDSDESAAAAVETSTSYKTETSENVYAAARMPLKGMSDMAKVSDRLPGWHENSEGKWYQNTDGTYYAGGFQQIGSSQYSFDDRGYVQTGWISSGVSDYYFNEDGTYNPNKTKPMLAMTFDDGPSQYTQRLLDCLKENGAHATFFMVGECIDYYSDIPAKVLEAGCEIGNHSWDHPLNVMTEMYNAGDVDGAISEFTKTDDKLLEVCGHASTVARMPGGSGSYEFYELIGKPFFLWSLDTLDWKTRDEDMDYDAVINGDLTDGSIILMHDIHEPSVNACMRIIPELVNMGFRLVTLSEMAEAKGVVLQNTSYSDFWQSSLNAGLVKGYTGESGLLSKISSPLEDDSVTSGEDSWEELDDGSYEDS